MQLVESSRFRREYKKLPVSIQDQVGKTLVLLATNPHHPSLRTHKRQGESELWQARVTRSYRIYFELSNDVIRLVSIVPHEK